MERSTTFQCSVASEDSNSEYKMLARNQRGEIRLMTIPGALTNDRSGKQFQYVLASPKSTNTRSKSTAAISPLTSTSVTSPRSAQAGSPTSIFSSAVSLARRLASPACAADSMTQEGRSSLTSLGFCERKDHASSYWKTSGGFFLMTMDELSRPSSPRLSTWGIASNGRCLTARITESPRTGSASSLLDILEGIVPDKYFLFDTTIRRLMSYREASATRLLRWTKAQGQSERMSVIV